MRTLGFERFDGPRLLELVQEFKSRKVLVVGDVGVDRYTIGAVDRISPEAPVPIVRVEREEHKLGLAANVADNIHALGGEAILVGIVGEDRGAEEMEALLNASGISDSGLVRCKGRRTVLKERVVSDRQQIVRIDYEDLDPVSARHETAVLAAVKSALKNVDVVIVQDYAKGMLTPKVLHEVARLAKAAKKPIYGDPNLRTPIERYRGLGCLTPNRGEAEKLSGVLIRDDRSLLEAGKKILKQVSARELVITLGKDGMAVFEKGGARVQRIPTTAREVFDVSGAGDTVIAVLALARAAGATLQEAAVLGNLAAGVEVGKRGTATVSPEELGAEIDRYF